MRLWRWCGASAAASVRVQGSRTCISAVPPTNISTTTNSINRDKATFLVSRIVTLLQINFMHCHVVMWPQANLPNVNSHCHLAEAKTSFLPCKEEDKLLHPCKMSKLSNITHANTTKCSFVFLILSYPNVYVRVQAFPSMSIPWGLRMEVGCFNDHTLLW